MHKTLFLAIAVLMILTLFGGCQLAVDDSGRSGDDMLCGVFITFEYLESDFNEENIDVPLNRNGNPNEIIFPETRIYAKRIDNGGSVNYVFDDLEGIRFFGVEVDDLEQNENYYKTVIDSEIVDGNVNVNVGDSSVNRSLSGTVYFDVHYPCTIYANPVYQTPEGDVYVTNGSGMSFGRMQVEGSQGTTTLSETKTITEDSKKTSSTLEVEIKVEGANSNNKVVLKQMGSDDQLIAEEVIVKDNIPESMQLLPDQEYLIMEEHCTDFEGNTVIKRTLLDIDKKETLEVRFTGDNGIVQTYPVTLQKDKAECR